ncbi:methyltransferase family protein [Hephaestia caeni]|uniref:Methyltransferase family protein n=1 Tax=Hephaestia caeni TaxID=645617 RepID=A0A397P9R3_9SPHN|nr:methyltransferase domain-containing protein [Hephaestia caeni]RIA46290.1 methyltransferase family protein [Hephaestia caeni]
MSLRSKIEARILRRLLALVREDGAPNLNALNDIVKHVRILELNMKAFGYDLARRMASALPARPETQAAPVGLGSKACVQADIESDWCGHWAGELKTAIIYHRKLWEFSYVLQALYEHGHLSQGRKGLGFGCGAEPLPSYLASLGIHVTATDVSVREAQASGWLETGQHLSQRRGHHPDLVDEATFARMVTHRDVDMNAIPASLTGFDFCWSICALEHLGSIGKGLAFIEASLATLRPGGLAVHTLEFNVENDGPTVDNWITVLFQQRHLEAISTRLRSQGHKVEELDFDMGSQPMDWFIDLPPWHHDAGENAAVQLGDPLHLKLAIDGFVSTSFGIIIQKAL